MKKNYLTLLTSSFLTLLLTVLSFHSVHAQMFSVEERDERPAFDFRYTSLSFGWEFAEFQFQGDPETAGNERSDFDNGILKAQFETPDINVYLGLAGNLTGMENQSYVNFGASIYNYFVLSQSETYRLLLPVQINIDLLRTQRDGITQQFQQSAFQAGAGGAAEYRLRNSLLTSVELVPRIGFSSSQGGVFGGRIFSLEGKARMVILNAIGSNGLVLGYNYNHKSYTIDEDIFDYDFNGHSITLGITF